MSMSSLFLIALFAGPVVQAAVPPVTPPDSIIRRLPTSEKVVALTFDACEAGKRATLDHGITDFLISKGIPFTVFVSGRFVHDNAAAMRDLATHPFVEIENHSWSHPSDMRTLSDTDVRAEVLRASTEIYSVTARKAHLFRFPGGYADDRVVALVRDLGFEVVHWRWAEGDPSRSVSADTLVQQTLAKTRPGEVLIFHINGRGWHTAEALPAIVDGLSAAGYQFVLPSAYLPQTHQQAPRTP